MDKIDRIFYINLDRRTDRNEEMISEFKKMNIINYERFPAISDNIGCNGCMKSHLEVLKIARDRKYTSFIILEDDFQFLVSQEELQKEMSAFFDLRIPYRVVMLAYNIQKSDLNINSVISRIIEASNAAGYMVSGDFVNTLVGLFEENYMPLVVTGKHWIYANDQCWKKYQDKDWYFFNKRIGKQRPSYSDLGMSFVSRDN